MSTAATSRCAAGLRLRHVRGQLPARTALYSAAWRCSACARPGGCREAGGGGAAAERGPKRECAAAQLALLHALGNPSKALRHVVGTNIAVIVVAGGLAAWPELLVRLVQCLESSDAAALEGALDALYKVRRLAAPPARPRPACRGRGRLSGLPGGAGRLFCRRRAPAATVQSRPAARLHWPARGARRQGPPA